MHRISWIHLSDLHFEWTCNSIEALTRLEEQQDLQKRDWTSSYELSLMSSIVQDVSNFQSRGINPGFLFVTGDLVSGPTLQDKVEPTASDMLRASVRWCVALASRLNIKQRNIYIVPGNHDVTRYKSPGCLQALDELHTTPTANQAKVYSKEIETYFKTLSHDKAKGAFLEHLQDYRDALRACGLKHCSASADLTFVCEHATPIGQVLVYGLNSAWPCIGKSANLPNLPSSIPAQIDALRTRVWRNRHKHADDDTAAMLFNAGISQSDPSDGAPISPWRLNKRPLSICLIHHPISWLHPIERPLAHKMATTTFDFLLRGHEHVEWVNQWGATILS